MIDLGDFDQPIHVAAPPGDNSRLMVVQKEGLIQVLEGGAQSTFLDVETTVGVESGGEQGLLSMAFAPDYATSGRFYVYYTAADGSANRVDEFQVSANRSVADTGTRRPVISIPHGTAANHNGGTIAFGPDGFLYIAPGDGGNTADLAQDIDSLSGKVLRIDPRSGATYTIPPGNPFAGPTPGADEVFHLGLRNPFRFSFDRGSGDLIIGDVGSSGPNRTEEVTLVPAGTPAGRNFGWPECEGTTCTGTEPPDHFKPALQYQRPSGSTAVTGGVVVRDPAIPELLGQYIYADFYASPIRAATLTAQAGAGDGTPTGLGSGSIAAFNEDNAGCVYVTSLGGNVFRLAPDTGPAPVPCAAASQQPPPGGGTGDRTAPLLSARVPSRQRVLRNRGAIGYGRCNELCRMSMTARARIGRLVYPLRTARANRRGGRRARLRARLTRRSRRALLRALARGRRPVVVVVLSATDPAGNASRRVRFRIRVRR
ncbi:MAG TPA: PQQ-dependent sugar dehydrogenase [Thermoleophilaceae bacterium]|nr:PQQ-dependent sugar dehydrogenase [Thermoleophilaceae bacterium]